LIIYLLILTAEEKNSKQFYIECKGDETFWLQADGTMTIDNFKAKIETDQGIPAHEQRLVFAGKQLEGSHTISKVVTDAGEVETCRLHFILESTGGGIIYSLIWKPFEHTEHNRGQYIYIYIHTYYCLFHNITKTETSSI